MADSKREETVYGETWENAQFFHNEAQRILNEAVKHCDFMRKVKQDIQKRKETYFGNVSFTEVFDSSAVGQKENFTI
jgi:heme oxygenase